MTFDFKAGSASWLALVFLSAAFLIACGGSGGSSDSGTPGDDELFSEATLTAVLETNAEIAFNGYTDSLEGAQTLLAAIETLIATPTDDNLTAAKAAWLSAREPYGQTEAYRFRLGPIDSTDGIEEDGPEGQINAWPLAEALIDYVAPVDTGAAVDGADEADTFPPAVPDLDDNAIADSVKFPTIDTTTIVELNEADEDEANVATGYHAIEFLLWGQDLYNNPPDTTWTGTDGDDRFIGGGNRPVSDYSNVAGECTSGEGNVVGDSICVRRGEYLVAAAELLIDDLQGLVDEWDPAGTGNHYDDFVGGGEVALSIVLESMGRLGYGELAGERMNIALEQDSQEDEHSCFSDNTHRDIVLNAQGIANSYFGTYESTSEYATTRAVDGTGIDDLLIEAGLTAEEAALTSAIEAALAAVEAINASATDAVTPVTFDMLIAPGSGAGGLIVREAIDALVDQTNAIQDAINALELETGDLKQDTEEAIE